MRIVKSVTFLLPLFAAGYGDYWVGGEWYTLKPINSFVVMFDFLGFKDLRNGRGTEGIYRLYMRNLLPHIQHAAALSGKIVQRNGQSEYVPDFGPQSIAYGVVSDSIILFANGDSFDHFLRMILASHSLLCSGFTGNKAPLRGAIGYGDLIYDGNSIWIGSAIEDAYDGESSQVWSGCAITPVCEQFVSENGYINQYRKYWDIAYRHEQDHNKAKKFEKAKRRIVEYDIPKQCNPKTGPVEYGVRKGYALDWTLNVYEGAGEKAFLRSTDNHVKMIIENTIKFEKWARVHNR
ncbi:MAG: hypothetical protein E3K38_12985 [Candidatus Kuenenia stuttgartiensis]|nr:hypothetical protein [Candidatus Kuenenia stuttgartiensis]